MCISLCFFVFNVRCLVLSLPVKWMGVLWNIFHCWKQTHDIPDRIVILKKDLIAFRKKVCIWGKVILKKVLEIHQDT